MRRKKLEYYEGGGENEMLMIFYRKVILGSEQLHTQDRVMARVVALVDGRGVEVGELKFPTKQVWSKFIGAVQRGALEIPDLEVRMENALDNDYDDNQGPEDISHLQPPTPKFTMTDLEKKAADIHKVTLQRQAEEAAATKKGPIPAGVVEALKVATQIPAPTQTVVSKNEPKVVIQGEPITK